MLLGLHAVRLRHPAEVFRRTAEVAGVPDRLPSASSEVFPHAFPLSRRPQTYLRLYILSDPGMPRNGAGEPWKCCREKKVWRTVKLFQQHINQTPASFSLWEIRQNRERVFLDIKKIFFFFWSTLFSLLPWQPAVTPVEMKMSTSLVTRDSDSRQRRQRQEILRLHLS